jgi:hypothetical protein
VVNEGTFRPIEIETPRVAAAPHPDLPNNPNAGDIGSTPNGQPASSEMIFTMNGNAISLLENRFNLPDRHFGGQGASLHGRQLEVLTFFTGERIVWE